MRFWDFFAPDVCGRYPTMDLHALAERILHASGQDGILAVGALRELLEHGPAATWHDVFFRFAPRLNERCTSPARSMGAAVPASVRAARVRLGRHRGRAA